MGTLPIGHRELIENLRRAKVLQDMDEQKFNPTRLAIVACSDGQRLPEITTFHLRLAENQMPGAGLDSCCIHTLALNGGGLLLAEESPVVNPNLREDRVFHQHLCDAIRIKGLDANGERPTVVLYTHMPCGAAELHDLDPLEQMELIALAKDRLKTAHPAWRILLCVHVHYPTNGREEAKPRTYHFSRKHLQAWLADSYSSGLIFRTRSRHGLAAARA
ncbi:MAG: hypothetical protein UU49_C0004G0016 [Candidatus Magasanikbacteria bacterium GW2011_GWC2_41_17]|uniref:Uncharacterized protein n=2 Tax=Candidatus Magasanikiibacteriota TaxID=1752731 RepID=A0A0G1A6C0_9BACT|nr:MAG: hypothetical protein UU49_C0004G0016 [Candidatus Magasanikbacteria bacterium GW2011_GWC2_41_17]KKS56592.1 MAG: hypothetical protein UV20_C0009G0071 [Candidatus Magasanikbacteria bacterium GW2011_GWA2_42_32]